ncbi:hypothetical protein KY330_00360 [Candidatus Woesearchaeota archaeon]|nr:hypothetical protein [Candidatus Woesearchaeota archaeon]
MSFLDKLKFWKKEPELEFEKDFPDLEVPKEDQPIERTFPSAMPEDRMRTQGFSLQQPGMQPGMGERDLSGERMISKDFEIISAKLDAIKAQLDAMNVRLHSLERIAAGEKRGPGFY